RKLPKVGVPGGLRGYTTQLAPRPGTSDAPTPRDPIDIHEVGIEPWDRLQTLSGIQYYFTSAFSLAEGYTYLVHAEWALSAINAHQFWSHRPTLERDGYVSILSVDVGDWNVPVRKGPRAG